MYNVESHVQVQLCMNYKCDFVLQILKNLDKFTAKWIYRRSVSYIYSLISMDNLEY